MKILLLMFVIILAIPTITDAQEKSKSTTPKSSKSTNRYRKRSIRLFQKLNQNGVK